VINPGGKVLIIEKKKKKKKNLILKIGVVWGVRAKRGVGLS